MFLINNCKGRFCKMKRKLVFALWILLIFGFVSVNCSAQSSSNDQRIVGTWLGNTSTSATATFIFNANGSGSLTATDEEGTDRANFTYGVSADGLITMIADSREGLGRYLPGGKIFFSPDSKILILDGKVYRKR